jgi:hypothetical protein
VNRKSWRLACTFLMVVLVVLATPAPQASAGALSASLRVKSGPLGTRTSISIATRCPESDSQGYPYYWVTLDGTTVTHQDWGSPQVLLPPILDVATGYHTYSLRCRKTSTTGTIFKYPAMTFRVTGPQLRLRASNTAPLVGSTIAFSSINPCPTGGDFVSGDSSPYLTDTFGNHFPKLNSSRQWSQQLKLYAWNRPGTVTWRYSCWDDARWTGYDYVPLAMTIRVTATDYAALGDSYSSGEGNGYYQAGTDTEPDSCHRSFYGYPEILRRSGLAKPAPYRFVACSGATTAAMNSSFKSEPPQLFAVTAATRYVTLSFGGNDIGFADIIKECVEYHPCRTRELEQALPGKIDALYLPLRNLYQTVSRTAPQAIVVVQSYPHLLTNVPGTVGVGCFGACYISSGDAAWLNDMADELEGVISFAAYDAEVAGGYSVESAGDAEGFTVGPFDPSWPGHGLGDADPWLYGVRSSPVVASFHPNMKGQCAYALNAAATVHLTPVQCST